MDAMARKKTEPEQEPVKSITITVQVTEQMAAALDELAYKRSRPGARVSRSEIVRDAIDAYLPRRR